MEHYNLLYVEEGSPGLYVLRTREENSLVQKLSELPHENIGDFYSNVPCEELANRVSQILHEASLARKIEVVDAHSFDENKIDDRKDYIIREKKGVRIYLSEACRRDRRELYEEFSAYFLEALFSNEKEGSIQIEFKELERYFTEAKVRIEDLYKEIEKGLKELKDEVIVAEVLTRPKRGKQVLN